MLLSQLAVALCVAALSRHCFSTQFPLHRCRRAHDQGPGRDIFGDHSSCCDQGAGSHADPIEHNRSNPNQAAIVEGGAMDDGPVANGHIAANQYRIPRISVQYGTVLNIAAFADADAGEVPTGHCGGPEARACLQLNITNHHSARCHPGGVAEVGLRPGSRAHGAGVVRVIIFGFAPWGTGR